MEIFVHECPSLKQGQELTVRQMALLGFRDLVLMKLSLDDLLRKNLSLIPASITQMLLVLQGIQESRGPSKEYYQLESPVARVVKLELQTHNSRIC
uniref:Si:dkey-56p7.10 n=1 Tax=Cyprinus carpio carpio TaxID=630221 RepID=A0A9J7XSP9_CYPCA